MSESDKPTEGELILYQTAEGTVRIEVLYESETFWLNQKKIAELFGVDLRTISYHLSEIYASGELQQDRTLRKVWRVQTEGSREVRREIEFYNLDAIISVGYRVNSTQATQFRIWATQTLREFIIKGFVLDDERLKLNKRFGKDYFEELLERIREVRASERRFYLKITDIYEQCSIDYDKDAEITKTFFKTVQNKLHWAVTGNTAAEIIAQRADARKPSMGLTTWKNAPKGKILLSRKARSRGRGDRAHLRRKKGSREEQRGGASLDFRPGIGQPQARRYPRHRPFRHAIFPQRLRRSGGHALPLDDVRFFPD